MNSKQNRLSDAPLANSLEVVAQCIPTTGIDFGYCTVGGTVSTRTICLSNMPSRGVAGSSVRYSLQIDDNSHFSVSHDNGVIQTKKNQEIIISFKSTEAKVVIGLIVFKLQDAQNPSSEITKTLKVSAIGKYPFITIDQSSIEFAPLLVSKSETKEIVICNSSQVPTSFKIERVGDDGKDNAIKLSHFEGELIPGATSTVVSTYTPQIPEMISCAYYKVKVEGGNELNFSCRGQAEGFDVELSAKTLHFGEVQLDTETNRILNVCNNSDLPTQCQFITDSKNMFSFSQNMYTVKPHSSQRIVVNFKPSRTGNYYERVFCVVRNHRVLYVDLMGSCFDILTKPVPLLQKHVDIYRHKVIMGAHNKKSSNAKKNQLASEMMDATLNDRTLISMNDTGADMDFQLEIPIDDPSQVILHKEMLQLCSSDKRELQLSVDSIDFGFTNSSRQSEPKHLTFYNKFTFPVRVDWTLLAITDKTSGKKIRNPFNVTPVTQEVPAKSQQQFAVDFAPYEPDSYFFQIAQCFVHLLNGNEFKTKQLLSDTVDASKTSGPGATKKGATINKTLLGSMKKSKFVDFTNEEVDPPVCLSMRLSGHSFAPGSQPFIPMVKLSSTKVDFAPCSPGESVYQSVILTNNSDTPVLYKCLQDSTNTFTAFPPTGLIPGKSFSLVTFEFSPKTARFFNFASQFIFNNSTANLQTVSLQGFAYSPKIVFPQDKLFFPPTYSGVSQRQKFSVKNESRVALEFEWKVPEKYTHEVQVQPVKSLLMPNEEQMVMATFTALKKKKYEITIPLFARNLYDRVKHHVGFFAPGSGLSLTHTASNMGNEDGIVQIRKAIQIIGAGSDGTIQISPAKLDFGTITVGESKTLSIILTNSASCNLFVELMMQAQDANGEASKQQQGDDIQKILNECFRFDHKKGIVNGKSKMKVNITFKPSCRFQFETALICVAKEKMPKELTASVKEAKSKSNSDKMQQGHMEKASIQIKCKGDYPLLRFTDVRNDQVSIANLWERYNMTAMNKELLQPLSQSEFFFNNSDKTNASNEELMEGLRKFTWDFGKVPIRNGTKPRRIVLTLKNVGGVPADWRFKMPNDSEIEMESWADPGEPTPEQAFEKHILNKKIFVIEQKSGTLQPGEQMDCAVLYYPKEVMKHYLNIFFQITNGKPLLLRFEGETLHRRAQLQMLKHTYVLPPVPIGLEWPITTPIEIKNLGITKLKYQIDTEKLEQLNSANYDFRIFDIQNPEGTLKSNETQHIYTLFRPLEAKSYSLDLPIRVSDIEGPSAESYFLRLRGTGYHHQADQTSLPVEEEPFFEDLPLCRAHLTDNGSMAAFSTESIDFGELEQGELSKRFVILYNLSSNQKMRFDFQKSGLMCGDNLKLEPMSGELKPNSHVNIKMTLEPSKYPTYFEGEIQCSIDWEGEGGNEARSVHTTTNVLDSSEYLFLRMKKRSKISKILLGADVRRGESLIENIVNEAMNDILESDAMDKLLEECTTANAGLYSAAISNQAEPAEEDKQMELAGEAHVGGPQLAEQLAVYEENLREVTGVDDDELFRKRMFMQEPFVELMEFMLEDTMFNLMEEATYEEFDLTMPPKIYIRKDH